MEKLERGFRIPGFCLFSLTASSDRNNARISHLIIFIYINPTVSGKKRSYEAYLLFLRKEAFLKEYG